MKTSVGYAYAHKPAWLDQVNGAKRRLRILQVTATTDSVDFEP